MLNYLNCEAITSNILFYEHIIILIFDINYLHLFLSTSFPACLNTYYELTAFNYECNCIYYMNMNKCLKLYYIQTYTTYHRTSIIFNYAVD